MVKNGLVKMVKKRIKQLKDTTNDPKKKVCEKTLQEANEERKINLFNNYFGHIITN